MGEAVKSLAGKLAVEVLASKSELLEFQTAVANGAHVSNEEAQVLQKLMKARQEEHFEAATASKHELREVAAMRGALAHDVDRVGALSRNLESILGNTCGEISKFQLAMVTSTCLAHDQGRQSSQQQLVDDSKVEESLAR